MWNRIRNLSLRKQLALLFCTTILMGILVQIFYSLNIYVDHRQDNIVSSHAVITKTDALLSQTVDQIAKAGSTAAINGFLQEYMILQNEASQDTVSRRNDLKDAVIDYLEGIVGSNNAIMDIAIIGKNNWLFTYCGMFTYGAYNTLKTHYDLEENKEGFLTPWLGASGNDMGTNGFAYVLPVYYTSSYFAVSGQRLGTCVIWCRQNAFNDIVNATAVTENSTVLIVDSFNRIVSYKSPVKLNELSESLSHLSAEYEQTGGDSAIRELMFLGKKSYVLIQTNSDTGWKSINITPAQEINTETMGIFYFGIGLAMLTIIVSIIPGVLMIKGVTKPLVQITKTLKEIGEGNHNLRLSDEGNNEFGLISRSINAMLDNMDGINNRIFDMQTKLYESEILQKESEMTALQSQINPHFLYNTFECIRSIAIVKKIKEISVLSASMANIFRYTTKGGIFTSVKEELDCINDYYKIISIRFWNRLRMSVDITDALYSCRILKMSLLPLVENSVNHSLEMTLGIVDIHVRGWIEEGLALFSITDNGVGISEEKIGVIHHSLKQSPEWHFYDNARQRSSIGLSNINVRLKLYYGEQCGLSIESKEQVGTKVTVRMGLEKTG